MLSGTNAHADLVEIAGDSDQPEESTPTVPDVSSAPKTKGKSVGQSYISADADTIDKEKEKGLNNTRLHPLFAVADEDEAKPETNIVVVVVVQWQQDRLVAR